MKFLIAMLNNVSDWLLYKLSDKIILKLWNKIENENNIECVVTYEYNDSLELHLNIFTNEQLNYDNELKVFECVGLINDLYPMLSIEPMLYQKEQYEKTHGKKFYEVNRRR